MEEQKKSQVVETYMQEYTLHAPFDDSTWALNLGENEISGRGNYLKIKQTLRGSFSNFEMSERKS